MKLGRKPRRFNPRIPHLSAFLGAVDLPPPPASADWTAGLPDSLGVMNNDSLGCCTCAAFYHAIQVWSWNVGHAIDTESDANVLALYEAACGYVPGNPATDQGGDEQSVLSYILNTGAPTAAGPHHLLAFVEVDPRNLDDVKRSIADAGICYIGFNVPNFLMSGLMTPGATWDVNPTADNRIEGGHAVVLAGYDASGVRVVSWGNFYTMTWAFFGQFVDECYALCDPAWFDAAGTTLGGLTVDELEQLMQGIREQQ